MVELIFARHGQTDWNLQKRLQGVLDIPLNSKGIDEASELRDAFNIDVKEIISSPLSRAYKTAEIINEKLNLPIRTDRRLQERDFGSLAGQEACFVKTMEISSLSDVEHIEVFGDKLMAFLEDCQNLDDGKYLITTHGGVIITLLSRLTNNKINWENTPITNCSLTSLKFNELWEIVYYNQSCTNLLKTL